MELSTGSNLAVSAAAAALCLILTVMFGFLAWSGVRRAPNGALALLTLVLAIQMAGYAGMRTASNDASLAKWSQLVTACTITIIPLWLGLVRAVVGRPSRQALYWAWGAAAFLLAFVPSALMLGSESVEWNRLGVHRHPVPGPFYWVHFIYAAAGISIGAGYWLVEVRRHHGLFPGGVGRLKPVAFAALLPGSLMLVNLLNLAGLVSFTAPMELVVAGLMLAAATGLFEEFVATHRLLEGELANVNRLNEEIFLGRERERELAEENQRLLREEIRSLRHELGTGTPVSRIVGTSAAIQELTALVGRVAVTETTVLITGETGTGKELIAQELHRLSPRSGKPFLAVNVAALPEPLLESELFGHIRGAFTGADRDRAGLFELSGGGTLFLDEIGEASPALQVKLLRVLQERTIQRVGSAESINVDVRIVAATHRDLDKLQREGRFRQDLFFRLNVIRIDVPPLRQRADDIPLLAGHFLRKHAERQRKPVQGISRKALASLTAHPWPGNIRELENVIERAVALTETDLITAADLPPSMSAPVSASATVAPEGGAADLTDAPVHLVTGRPELAELERRYLYYVLEQCGGVRAEAARQLGIDVTTLYRRLKQYEQTQDPDAKTSNPGKSK